MPRHLQLAVLFVLSAGVARAQPSAWNGRTRVSINAGAQVAGEAASQSFSLTKNLEAAPVSVTLPSGRAIFIDGGATIRVRGNLGIGISVSALSHDIDGSLSAQIPHPSYDNQPRPISGTAAGLTRSETAVHLDAAYIAPSRGKVAVIVFGGVSIFNVGQKLVTDINYKDEYPFDAPTFTSATSADASTMAVGFNAGTDVTWKLSRKFGVGALVRFSRASVTLSSGAGNSVSTSAGGLQAGGGVRIAF
jgi:hypothetical protein